MQESVLTHKVQMMIEQELMQVLLAYTMLLTVFKERGAVDVELDKVCEEHLFSLTGKNVDFNVQHALELCERHRIIFKKVIESPTPLNFYNPLRGADGSPVDLLVALCCTWSRHRIEQEGWMVWLVCHWVRGEATHGVRMAAWVCASVAVSGGIRWCGVT